MSVTSVDPFWSALEAYDTGTEQLPATAANAVAAPTSSSAASASTAAPTSTSTGLSSDPAVAEAEASAGTMMAVLGAAPSTSGASADLLSNVLGGQSSGAVTAVSAAVNQSILDTLL